MERKLAHMQTRVATIRKSAEQHASRLEQRQALLAAALTGVGDEKKLALATLKIDPTGDRLAAFAMAPFGKVERRQSLLAGAALEQLQARYQLATQEIRERGLRPERLVKGRQQAAMGGPLIPAASAEAVSPPATENASGKLLAPNTTTGPSAILRRRRSGRGGTRSGNAESSVALFQ